MNDWVCLLPSRFSCLFLFFVFVVLFVVLFWVCLVLFIWFVSLLFLCCLFGGGGLCLLTCLMFLSVVLRCFSSA